MRGKVSAVIAFLALFISAGFGQERTGKGIFYFPSGHGSDFNKMIR